MTPSSNTDRSKSLATQAPSANNHIELIRADDGDKPSAYPAIPPSEQTGGAESDLIEPLKQPDA